MKKEPSPTSAEMTLGSRDIKWPAKINRIMGVAFGLSLGPPATALPRAIPPRTDPLRFRGATGGGQACFGRIAAAVFVATTFVQAPPSGAESVPPSDRCADFQR